MTILSLLITAIGALLKQVLHRPPLPAFGSVFAVAPEEPRESRAHAADFVQVCPSPLPGSEGPPSLVSMNGARLVRKHNESKSLSGAFRSRPAAADLAVDPFRTVRIPTCAMLPAILLLLNMVVTLSMQSNPASTDAATEADQAIPALIAADDDQEAGATAAVGLEVLLRPPPLPVSPEPQRMSLRRGANGRRLKRSGDEESVKTSCMLKSIPTPLPQWVLMLENMHIREITTRSQIASLRRQRTTIQRGKPIIRPENIPLTTRLTIPRRPVEALTQV